VKRVAVIGTVGLPPKYGGFETLAYELVTRLKERFRFTVYCSSKSYSEKAKEFEGTRTVYIPLRANGIQSVPYDMAAVVHALFHSDVLLILGVSGGIILPLARALGRKKIVVNIDGLEWQRAKWSAPARKYLKLSERLAVANADVIIADNAEIQRYVMNEYRRDSLLIAYGGDHALPQRDIGPHKDEFEFLGKKYAFGVCRVEPENNVDCILKAFSGLDGLPLVMVGNWDNSAYGKDLRAKYDRSKDIHLLNAIYDRRKLDVLRSNCYLYVHGHSAGGTNPSLVEAMSLGLPVIAYDAAYNRETTENNALFFKNSGDLAEILKKVDIADLRQTAKRLSEVAGRRYRWREVADAYARIFEN
jgi:glycosyltransferase involved in cell wall biosynthesis